MDSHVTQLFAALLLFIFGTGPVKGFAVTLTVGVVASLFTSIYISHFIYDWILERYPDTKTLSVGTHSFFENVQVRLHALEGAGPGHLLEHHRGLHPGGPALEGVPEPRASWACSSWAAST